MIPLKELCLRLSRVKTELGRDGLKALYVSDPRNVYYLTGLDTGCVLITKKTESFFMKELYLKIHGRRLHSDKFPYSVYKLDSDSLKRKVRELRIRELAADDRRSVALKGLRKQFGVRVKVSGVVESVRKIKSPYEFKQIEKSAEIARKGMKKAYQVVGKGRRELDCVAEIEAVIRKSGSESPPFQEGMLLASGSKSANIHARAGLEKIRRGLVVVDLGAKWEGYYSDMTRTIPVGRLTKREKDLLEFIQDLELNAIDRVDVGTKAADIHGFVEEELCRRGFRFYHSTGHGVGLQIHENPNLGKKSRDVLQEGMVFTVEPGIYIPGKFGVRFEDMVYLSKKGPRILTK
ncbi:M24 family metallopeptidase [Candidatus Altiarchaeota archaeon]